MKIAARLRRYVRLACHAILGDLSWQPPFLASTKRSDDCATPFPFALNARDVFDRGRWSLFRLERLEAPSRSFGIGLDCSNAERAGRR